ncbi:MAG: 3-oxoacyl-[acyl-carrier protein] reductase, partial [uncultured Blastococcus sp.]
EGHDGHQNGPGHGSQQGHRPADRGWSHREGLPGRRRGPRRGARRGCGGRAAARGSRRVRRPRRCQLGRQRGGGVRGARGARRTSGRRGEQRRHRWIDCTRRAGPLDARLRRCAGDRGDQRPGRGARHQRRAAAAAALRLSPDRQRLLGHGIAGTADRPDPGRLRAVEDDAERHDGAVRAPLRRDRPKHPDQRHLPWLRRNGLHRVRRLPDCGRRRSRCHPLRHASGRRPDRLLPRRRRRHRLV